MASFDPAYAIVKKWEGNEVYAWLKDDDGGETYAGIARVPNPGWPGWPIIDQEKKKYRNGRIPGNTRINNAELSSAVKSFYLNLWLKKAKGDKIQHQQMANLVFDMCVNHGRGPKLVNEAIVNAGGKISVSNTITGDTLNFLNKAPEKIYPFIIKRREQYYRSLADFKAFGNGWLNRLASFPLNISPGAAAAGGGALLLLATLFFF